MLITGSNISKTYALKKIVDNVSFTIEEQDKIALVGVNGTGKSTLLKIIVGKEDFEGKIIKKKDITISYLSQNPDFEDNLTVMEQVYKFIPLKTPDYEIKAILNKLGITNYEQKIKELSGGQQKRVALSITLLNPCDLLVLDEPTNHLDNQMIDYLEKYLKGLNKAILMVTHDRYFLERVTNKIIEVDRSKLYEYNTNYSNYLELKALREETEINQQRKRKLFLKKEIEWVRAGVQARTTKSKDRLQRFEKLSSVADYKENGEVQLINTASRLGRKTIELNNISFSYDDKVLFENFTYQFKRYDRIGILGVNGSGKSTLLKIISKTIEPTIGTVEHGETIKIGYFKQDHGDMPADMRVIDYIQDGASIIETNEGQLTAKQMCERFLFDTNMQYTQISRLSGGEKRRLYLLRILMSAPNVLILDEPSNDLDIETLQILEDYLDAFAGIIIVVSHDRYFIDRVCDHLFILKNKTFTYQIGGYSDHIILLDKKNIEKKLTTNYQNKEKKIKLSYNEKKELEQLEAIIPTLEQELKDTELAMNNVTDYELISSLSATRDELENQIEIKSERWLELLEKNGE